MNQVFFDVDEVLVTTRGALGVITLNRPKALNALTIDMIRNIGSALRRWENDKTIKAVLFLGAGDRAFCAGGDLKAFHHAGMGYRRGEISHKASSVFFAEEYSLNKQIFHYPKPTIAFMNGIVMGGGYGIGGNCAHRAVTEKSLFAMPETAIGFFPDVGSVFHLLRSPRNFGRMLGLTGARVNAEDMIQAGLADYFIPSHRQDELISQLERGESIQKILLSLQERVEGESVFVSYGDKINLIFGQKDALNILKALDQDGSAWAVQVFETIQSRSPTSVAVTAAHLQRCAGCEFDDVIAEDFILAQRFLQHQDFYEGIRGAVIDKAHRPNWSPASLEDIKPGSVESYFEPTGHNLKDIRLFAG